MKKILLLIGGTHHPFESCARILEESLERTGQCQVEITDDRAELEDLGGYDVVLLYTCGGELSEAQEKSLCNFVRRGRGVVAIHCANVPFEQNSRYMDLIGTRFTGHGPIATFDVEMDENAEEILPRLKQKFTVTDEFYSIEKCTRGRLTPFLSGAWQFEKKILGYVRSYGKGRVFYTALGHDERVFRLTEFQDLILKGIRHVTRETDREGTIRMGLLGYGPLFNMGGHHAGGARNTRGLELLAVCDKDPERLKAAKEEQGKQILTYTDAKAMARSGKIDMAAVILPHSLHFEGIKTFLERGIHVITEKPFAVTVDECDKLIALAQKKGVMLTVNHNRHWDPDITTILEVLRSGKIGELYSLECNMCGFGRPGQAWRTHKPISGGIAYDMGAHQFEKVFQLVPRFDGRGNPINRKARLVGNFLKKRWFDTTCEDFARLYVQFDSGLEAQLMVSRLGGGNKPLWTVLGTRGSIVIDSFQAEKHRVITYSDEGREVVFECPATRGDSSALYRNIGDHLLSELPLLITAQTGKRPIQCIEGCEQAARENRMMEIDIDWSDCKD